ncbi:MAG: hypothetical protein HRU18_00860 [Pseudoalteromonas sp.]|uniref:hypothetical protein n=1 Tax=Pseudoalteromonas sp. TaxID=53249 RepID=UPI001DAB3E95|nr:hypothetical protein [Pseudoalteromonas sp.]NRA76730.1 hypothetical protein [Pseudoalteromonas sp.]
MSNIVIFEDGKSGRGSKAQLVKRGNKRILITFTMYNPELDNDEIVTEWFKIFKPSWSKGNWRKHNNKRKSAMYIHECSNEFYQDVQQTPGFENDFRDYRSKDYCDYLFC